MIFDDWFPGFTFFILILAPLLIFLLFLATLFSKFWNVKDPQLKRSDSTILEAVGYIPICYMLWVFYECFQYLTQTGSTSINDHFTNRLFFFHLPWLTTIIIMVGIFEVIYYILATKRNFGSDKIEQA